MIADAAKHFVSDGRGPELIGLVWGPGGCQLLGANYRNPNESSVRHLRFVNAQAVMITADEVIGLEDPVGLVDLGKTSWLRELNPQHLSECRHFRARFYDEAVDVICEGVHTGEGRVELIQQGAAADDASRRG